MFKIILINVPVEKVVEEYDAPKYPSIGLAYLGSYLKKNHINVEIIDSKFEKLNLAETFSRIHLTEQEIPVFCLTSMTHEIMRVSKFAKLLKEKWGNCIIVLGGVHVSALPEQTIKEFASFDFGIVGEGELTFLELVNKLNDHEDLSTVKGLIYRKDNEIVVNKKRDWICDLDEIGFPDWSMFPRAKEYPINIGRGCPVPCIFCMRASGDKSRFRSAKNVLEELNYLNDNFKPEMIHFFGDDFAANKEVTEEILDGLTLMKRTFKWRAGMRVSKIDPEILKKMKNAGCQHIEIGVESGNVEILKKIKKGITLEQVTQVVNWCKQIKLHCWCYFILGHPGETVNTINDTINYLVKLNPTNAAIGIMVPYPGTKVWEMAKKGEEGYKIISDNWDDYNKQLGNALELESLTRKQLEMLQLKAYLKLFLCNFRIIDFIKFCWNYKKEGFALIFNLIKRGKKVKKN